VVNLHNFTLERPILASADQTRSHGIIADILPFLRIALAVPNQVIKKTALPQPAPAASDGGSDNAFSPANPATKIESRIALHKKMNVIRHNNVAT